MWALISSLALIDTMWLALSQVSLTPNSVPTLIRVVLSLPLGVYLTRKAEGRPTIHALFAGGTMLIAAWPVLRLFNHLTMTTAFPLADPWLAAGDAAIGFDWLAYVRWLDSHPQLLRLLALTYGNLTTYSFALFVILAVGAHPAQRCSEFIKLSSSPRPCP